MGRHHRIDIAFISMCYIHCLYPPALLIPGTWESDSGLDLSVYAECRSGIQNMMERS